MLEKDRWPEALVHSLYRLHAGRRYSLLVKKVLSKHFLVVGYVAVQLKNALFTFFSSGKQEMLLSLYGCSAPLCNFRLCWYECFILTFNFDEPHLNIYCINIWTYCIEILTLTIYCIFPLLLSLAGVAFPSSCKILWQYLYMFCFLFTYRMILNAATWVYETLFPFFFFGGTRK